MNSSVNLGRKKKIPTNKKKPHNIKKGEKYVRIFYSKNIAKFEVSQVWQTYIIFSIKNLKAH